MNSKIIVSIFCFVTFVTNMSAQTATSINIQDTRAVNDLPNFIGYGMRADFKQIASIGVPGEGYYSTNITIAPWNTSESSGGKNHQMNFNAGGIFYRNAFPTDPQWGTWRQILMTNENGNVGIGTSVPSNDQGWNRVLDVSGTNHSKILATSGNSLYKNGIFSHSSWHGGGGFIGTESNHSLFLMAGYDPKMTILTNGNVGIGTNSPATKLHVSSAGNSGSLDYNMILQKTVVTDNDKSAVGLLFSTECCGPFGKSAIVHERTGGYGVGDLHFLNNNTIDNTNPTIVNSRMTISSNGNVGIGTTNPTSKLTVAGNINSREVKVSVDAGADFVFERDYALPSLQEVEKFVTENKHLPEIASAKEMQREGINLSEMNIKLLQKIEELTLYVIEQQKLITQQANELESHKGMLAKIDQMEKTLAKMNTANEK